MLGLGLGINRKTQGNPELLREGNFPSPNSAWMGAESWNEWEILDGIASFQTVRTSISQVDVVKPNKIHTLIINIETLEGSIKIITTDGEGGWSTHNTFSNSGVFKVDLDVKNSNGTVFIEGDGTGSLSFVSIKIK